MARHFTRHCLQVLVNGNDQVAQRERCRSASGKDVVELAPQTECIAYCCRFAILIIASKLSLTSASVVDQLQTLIRIAVLPCHTVTPHQQVPSR